MFIDEAIITVRSGSGGNGCVSFRREKYIPRGGPDGGDGGDGGSVYLRASRQLATLQDVARQPVHRAEDGRPGRGNNCAGRDAQDLTVEVPVGTMAWVITPGRAPREGEFLGDFQKDGESLRVARGGKGGKGNKAFATSTHQAPREAEDGAAGEEKRIYLELRLLADVGLVGPPNVGKSTLLRRVSAARPKVADYPFTTLNPQLGIVELEGYRRLIFADIPGLIEGAHEGAGLGTEFLRHLERTRLLVHLVSVETGSVEEMASSYRTIEKEIASYSPSLAARPRIVVASKMDLLGPEAGHRVLDELSQLFGKEILPLSAVTGLGVRELLTAVAGLLPEE